MGIVHEAIQWYKLNRGRGMQVRVRSADLVVCPHGADMLPD